MGVPVSEPRRVMRWAVLWRDGEREAFLWDGLMPHLFMTRADARKHIEQHYGYIRHRADLRAPPHSWKMPSAVRVNVRLEACR